MKNIENKIKTLMKNKNMSMGKLSEITSIPKTTIHRYLNDAGTIPSDRLPIIASALNSTPEYIMGWDDNDEPSNIYGNHNDNLDHFSNKPELLKIYNDIYESESLQLLFDSARDLSPEDLESVLIHIQGIRKARGLD